LPRPRFIGLDIGSTTTGVVVAEARIVESPGRGPALADARELLRSPLVFTPFAGDDLDVARLLAFLDGWLAAADTTPGDLVGGGVLITGLAARAPGSAALVEALRARLGRALVATARDPRLEAWLAFMGNVAALSRARPRLRYLNLDIGGGTTNMAFGTSGEVARTGSLLVGARHVQVEPGGYRLVRLTPEARRTCAALALDVAPGRELSEETVAALLDVSIAALEAAVRDVSLIPPELIEAPIDALPDDLVPVFSGGVGELVYRLARGEATSDVTPHGDLGLDLARRIVASPVLGAALHEHAPDGGGRSVAFGLLQHATDLSGATLYLPRPDVLPLCDLPIVAALSRDSSDVDVAAAIALARAAAPGACLALDLPDSSLASVRAFADALTRALAGVPFPAARPLVLLASHNVGKALGGYLTAWGTGVHRDGLVVLDEVRRPGACFVHLGRPAGTIVPVSFFGMR
jgi:ethanolamine utilization protein EutA